MRPLVEASLALDVRRLVRVARAVPLPVAGAGTVTWRGAPGGAASTGWRLALGDDGRGSLVLDYAVDGEPVAEPVALTSTVPHYGGVRWWAVCPGCARRCALLYLAPGARRFRCRACAVEGGLAYASARQHNARVDALRRLLYVGELDAVAWRDTLRPFHRALDAAARAARALELGPYTPRRRRSTARR